MEYVKIFKPLESDPEIFTMLMHRLGVHQKFCFDDVLDYKAESEEPALALIVIFPESADDELEKAAVESQRQPILNDTMKFIKQTIDNSCGLIAVIHCVLNTVAANSISKPLNIQRLPKNINRSIKGQNSILYNAIQSSKGVTKFLEESEELESVYQLAVESGETEITDEVKYHYIALVGGVDGKLYELDGERSSPLIKGSSLKKGYILHDSEQVEQIINSFTRRGMGCCCFKLR